MSQVEDNKYNIYPIYPPISHAKIAVISGTMKISLFDIVLLNFKCSDFR